MEKLLISLVIIAHNEAHNLPKCLDSVAPWISEIIAVINDCTDNTKEVLEAYNAKVIEHQWEGMSANKNKALSYATQPWVLNLDADEEVPPALARSIHAFVKNPENAIGASIARKTWFLGKWIRYGDWYPDYTLRLFKREKGAFVGGKDHDRVEVQGPEIRLKGDLFHYSFPSTKILLSKISFFSDLYLERQVKSNKKFSPLATMIRALWRFIRAYIFRRGFLDGFPGLYIAVQQAFATFYRHSRLYEHNTQSIQPKPDKSDY